MTGVLPAASQPERGRRLLSSLARDGVPPRPELLYGYDAMRLVLDAIDGGGPNRNQVRARALAARERSGLSGRFEVRRSGSVAGRPLAQVGLEGGGPRTLP